MDQTLFHLINERWTNPVLDLFMAGISDTPIWQPFLVALFIIGLVIGGFKARACIVCLLLILFITDRVTDSLKSIVHRERPKQAQRVRMVVLQQASPKIVKLFKTPSIRFSDESDRNRSGPSFPSGHMTNNTAIATCLTVFYRRRGALYWIVTMLVGYSRIYLGAHWPSDVFATFFLALGETLMILAILELIWRSAARKWWPTMFAGHPSLLGFS